MVRNISDVVAGPERRTAHVIHYDISYVVQGAEHGTDGAIVLLHDIPAGAFSWADVMPQLASTGRAVYAIDMLGYGRSQHPWPADTSNWGHADCLYYLFNQLDLTNVVLVGHGLGGAVAQILATRLVATRVAALVLVDTHCYLHAFSPNWPMSEMAKRQDPDASKHISIEDTILNLRETLPTGSAEPQRFRAFMDEYVQPWNSELGKEVLFQHIRTLTPEYVNSVASDLRTIGRPVLIIWGEQDQQIPVSYAERLHREIPGSQLVIVPNAGHLILFDAPGDVASAIANFAGSLR